MRLRIYYNIRLQDGHDSWTYRDDHSRVVNFDTKTAAEIKIKQIFSVAASINAAQIIRVSEDEVSHIDKS